MLPFALDWRPTFCSYEAKVHSDVASHHERQVMGLSTLPFAVGLQIDGGQLPPEMLFSLLCRFFGRNALPFVWKLALNSASYNSD